MPVTRKTEPKYPWVITAASRVPFPYPTALRRKGDAVTVKISGVRTLANSRDRYFPFTFMSNETSQGNGLPYAFLVSVNGTSYQEPAWQMNGRFFNDVVIPNSPDNGGQFEHLEFPDSCKKLSVRDTICFKLQLEEVNGQMPIAVRSKLSIWKEADRMGEVATTQLVWSWLPDPAITLVVGNPEAVIKYTKSAPYPVRAATHATIRSVDFELS